MEPFGIGLARHANRKKLLLADKNAVRVSGTVVQIHGDLVLNTVVEIM